MSQHGSISNTWVGSAEINAKVLEGVVAGVTEAGEQVKSKAEELVPVDSGDLRDSMRLDVIDEGGSPLVSGGVGNVSGGMVQAKISANKEYAAYQEQGHRADGSHQVHNHPGGGQLHYLSNSLRYSFPLVKTKIAEAIKESIKI